MKNWLRNSIILALLFVAARIYLSYMWLTNAENKILFDFAIGPMLQGQVDSGTLPAWWERFLEIFVLPNTALFELMVTVGELGVGVALLVGLFTRFAAIAGILMNFSFYMTFQASLDLQMLVMQAVIVVFAASAGKIGLDPFWTRWYEQIRGNFIPRKGHVA